MFTEGWLWLPCHLTIVVILLSLFVFRKLIKERRIPSATAVTAGNDSSFSASDSSASACASASASPSALVGEYEVFLSFCGEDTRQTFTDFLYTSLVGARIRTFKDDNELRVGEKISSGLPKAIKESQISIPILSRNYASSEWCLIELAQMVECHETMGQEIFPIFFDVKPSDVRHQRGIYDQAFRQHEKHVDEKTVQEWKDALKKVGELKGLELKKETNGLQGELASRVTSHVLLKLKKNYLIDVPEEFFGMDGHVDKMMSRLDVGSSDVRIVGIAGMGGIGKTTIAKYIFNQLCERFNEGCGFIADIRERSKPHYLVKLQKELCSKILKDKDKISNVNEGLEKIRRRVHTKKVLIVLDDVDTSYQFDTLAGRREWFASGSRIIVTTRDKHVLNQIAVDSIYEPPPMESKHSLQLFSKHAFRRDSPPEEYDTLSRDFLPIAAGLPLALEIIGSHLCDKEISKWPGILKKFKEISHEDVQKKLEISYDTLDHGQKQIFLDIACFFIGKDKCDAVYMWDVCKLYPEDGIEALVLKSLVKIDDGDILWMHDQLRDLGRNIVRKENFHEPWNRSRVWSSEDALEIMRRCEVTQKDEVFKVEALCIDSALFMKYYFSCPKKEFGFLKNLRYLRVDEFHEKSIENEIGDLKLDFPKLRWLQWPGLSLCHEEIKFHLESLVILDVEGSRWSRELWNQIKMAKNLRVLNVSYCVDYVSDSDEIDGPILNLLGVPADEIDLDVKGLRFSESLEVLNLSYWTLLKRTPDLSNLKLLKSLKLSYCKSLQRLPNLSNLGMLKELDLSACDKLADVEGLKLLKSLKVLNLSECTSLQSIPDLSNLGMLKELDLSSCEKLADVEGLKLLKSLKVLNLSYCTSLQSIPDLSNLGMLKELDLSLCELADVEGLKLLKSLEVLNLSYCKSLQSIPDLSNLKLLKSLNLHCCQSLQRLPDLSNLGMLKELDLSTCEKLTDVEVLRFLKSLEVLNLSYSTSLQKIPDLSDLKLLKSLNLRLCISLERLPNLSKLGMLKELDLSFCDKLADVEGLRFLNSLEVLDLSLCPSLQRIPDLSNLKKLKELKKVGVGWI